MRVRLLVTALAVGLAVTAAAVLLGPDRITPAREHTGDADLAQQLAAHAETGHHRLAAFTIADGRTTFAGLGADEHDEFEIGSVTKTFTTMLIVDPDSGRAVFVAGDTGRRVESVADALFRELP